MSPPNPICVVLPPPDVAPAGAAGEASADAIAAAARDADLEPVVVERSAGRLSPVALERVLLAEHAVVVLDASDPSPLYVVGARDALRPGRTVAIWGESGPPPVESPSVLLHPPGRAQGLLRRDLVARLGDVPRGAAGFDPGNPVYALLGEWKPSPLSRTKTDVLRARAPGPDGPRRRIADALRRPGADAASLAEVEAGLGPLDGHDAETLVDLFLAYRAVSAWGRMVDLYGRLPLVLRRQVLLREQAAFALNRRAGADPAHPDRARATALLREVEASQGPSPETCALLGRIHKDLWRTLRTAEPDAARGHLRLAIEAYRRGWDADPRDAYPGINLLTLLDVDGAYEAVREERALLPVVRHFVERRILAGEPDYWDFATLLELAVLEGSEAESRARLADALARTRDRWEPATTADNLSMIADARRARGEDTGWLDAVLARLRGAS